ncbi:MAG TPA: ATP-dependent DNA helicase RecG, partial [Sutterella sp.]|nr:ATP-dependent DNA helicase RecG [Sutterella sp.]
GDVGSGKTIVAAMAAALAVQNGYQAAFMAPTEILAEQHYRKIRAWLEPLGVKILWLAGSLKPKEKAERQKALEQGEFQIAVGTHALIQNAVHYRNLALAIIDEQHRFGVSQRLKLRETDSDSRMPHMLMLSATPIPRTLAMSYLADVDVSVIDELPPGRTPITTRLVNLSRIEELEAAIDNAIGTGGQCYWVCPLIEESEKADLTAATMRAQYLADRHPRWRVGLVHGALSAEQKHEVMAHFSAGELDLLVATTVIEVGVDVPNASLMVIEHAERFGLAQLHQLRGRVGRGSAVSYCFMLYDPRLSEVGRERLLVIREHTDGFVIAREDLKLRGPGEFLGARQSGQPMLRFADIQTDADLLDAARNAAAEWLAEDHEKAALHARRWFSSRENYLDA